MTDRPATTATPRRPRNAVVQPPGTGSATSASRVAAAVDPVARIAVEVSLPHLDRPFDYLVPEQLAASVVTGSRVRVRFAGQLVDGFVLERLAETEHAGRLAFVERSVSPEVVLTPEIARLARATADRWAGTLADVLRLAVPPRHAKAETLGFEPRGRGIGRVGRGLRMDALRVWSAIPDRVARRSIAPRGVARAARPELAFGDR